jgi:hypothetical protein
LKENYQISAFTDKCDSAVVGRLTNNPVIHFTSAVVGPVRLWRIA